MRIINRSGLEGSQLHLIPRGFFGFRRRVTKPRPACQQHSYALFPRSMTWIPEEHNHHHHHRLQEREQRRRQNRDFCRCECVFVCNLKQNSNDARPIYFFASTQLPIKHTNNDIWWGRRIKERRVWWKQRCCKSRPNVFFWQITGISGRPRNGEIEKYAENSLGSPRGTIKKRDAYDYWNSQGIVLSTQSYLWYLC